VTDATPFEQNGRSVKLESRVLFAASSRYMVLIFTTSVRQSQDHSFDD